MSDPGKYRSPEELEAEKAKDPLAKARRDLLGLGLSEDSLKLLEADVEAEVQDAVKFADESPEPDIKLVEDTVYEGGFVY